MSTYLAAKECPYTYLDYVATHGRMDSMFTKDADIFFLVLVLYTNRQYYRYYKELNTNVPVLIFPNIDNFKEIALFLAFFIDYIL